MNYKMEIYFQTASSTIEVQTIVIEDADHESLALIVQHVFEKGVNFDVEEGDTRRHIPGHRILEIKNVPLDQEKFRPDW